MEESHNSFSTSASASRHGWLSDSGDTYSRAEIWVIENSFTGLRRHSSQLLIGPPISPRILHGSGHGSESSSGRLRRRWRNDLGDGLPKRVTRLASTRSPDFFEDAEALGFELGDGDFLHEVVYTIGR